VPTRPWMVTSGCWPEARTDSQRGTARPTSRKLRKVSSCGDAVGRDSEAVQRVTPLALELLLGDGTRPLVAEMRSTAPSARQGDQFADLGRDPLKRAIIQRHSDAAGLDQRVGPDAPVSPRKGTIEVVNQAVATWKGPA